MRIQLSDHFTYGKLIKFTLPSITMMIFTSIYNVVDGFFVSNFAGKTPFAAINLIMPVIMILGTVGFMFGTGGTAIVAKTYGMGNQEKANNYFSLFVYIAFAIGIVLASLGFIFIRPISSMLGASGELLENCVIYARISFVSLPFFVLQIMFQSFFVAAEKPHLGLIVAISSGVTNMVMDAVLVMFLPQEYKLMGAAIATAMSEVVGGVVPLFYFFRKNNSILRLGKIGYSIGTSPIFGYHDGARNYSELKSLLRQSIKMIALFGIAIVTFAELLAVPLANIFVGYDEILAKLTVSGFRIFSLSFAFMGFGIFASGFFTALNDGITSAIISFLRTLVFQMIAIMTLPIICGIDGVWISIVVAEFMSVVLGTIFLIVKRKKYHY